MVYKLASLKEIEDIYNFHMKKDFPPAELKPLSAIMFSVEKGWYRVFVAMDKDEILAYAFIADCGGGFGFLDYYAVVEKCRGKGIGTEFFKELSSLSGLDCFIIETESVQSSENEAQQKTRERRIAFYKNLGCIDTGCMYNVFGVEYNVLINKSVELTAEFLSKLLSAYEYAYAAILRRDDKDYIYRVK